MKNLKLSEEYALVLQQIDENGEEDAVNLAETLRFDYPRLTHILQNLKHKGLLAIENYGFGVMIHLTSKGKKFVQINWPKLEYISY